MLEKVNAVLIDIYTNGKDAQYMVDWLNANYLMVPRESGRSSLVGKRCGNLEAIEVFGKSGNDQMVNCKCDCGGTKLMRVSNFHSKNSKSCGECSKRGRPVKNENDEISVDNRKIIYSESSLAFLNQTLTSEGKANVDIYGEEII